MPTSGAMSRSAMRGEEGFEVCSEWLTAAIASKKAGGGRGEMLLEAAFSGAET